MHQLIQNRRGFIQSGSGLPAALTWCHVTPSHAIWIISERALCWQVMATKHEKTIEAEQNFMKSPLNSNVTHCRVCNVTHCRVCDGASKSVWDLYTFFPSILVDQKLFHCGGESSNSCEGQFNGSIRTLPFLTEINPAVRGGFIRNVIRLCPRGIFRQLFTTWISKGWDDWYLQSNFFFNGDYQLFKSLRRLSGFLFPSHQAQLHYSWRIRATPFCFTRLWLLFSLEFEPLLALSLTYLLPIIVLLLYIWEWSLGPKVYQQFLSYLCDNQNQMW